MEASMSLFVRSLTRVEGNHIQRILRHGKSRTPFRRAQVIIHSAHGFTVQEIAKVTCLHEQYIRELIRRFNKEGVDLFKERARTGRPVELVPEIRYRQDCPFTAQAAGMPLYALVRLQTSGVSSEKEAITVDEADKSLDKDHPMI
jgi:hypothetical protein